MLVKERLEWVDVYKGIAIILMVTGHATGLFNAYIYQFHMAAFLFVSGYVVNNKKDTIWKLVMNKFFTLLLPLITFVLCGSVLLYVLNSLGLCDKLFSLPYMGGFETIRIFFSTGDIYIQWLGACWFIIVLFGVAILNKIIWTFSAQNRMVYVLISIVLYLVGYEFVEREIRTRIGIFPVDLILIAQLYYVFGYIVKENADKINDILSNVWKNLISLIVNGYLLYWFPNLGNVTVDYPAHAFNSPCLDMVVAVNGILFTYNLAVIISKSKNIINKCLQYIGKNTMGILVFHFVAFKLLLVFFNLMGMTPKTQVKEVVPSAELSNNWWLLFVVISILFSLGLWELCKRIPVLNFVTGNKRQAYKNVIDEIENVFYKAQDKIREVKG